MALWDDVGNLALGVALPGLGGYIGSLGTQLLGGSGQSASQTSSQIYDATKKLNELSGYNAAGYKGQAVKSDYANALSGLGNSAEAVRSANMQNQMASRMLGSQQGAMDATNRNAQMNAASQTRGLTDIARNQSMGAGGVASIANQIGRGADNTVLAANAQNANNASSIAQGAGQLFGNSSNILNADLANRYNMFVKPHEYQENNLAQAGLNQFGPMTMQNYQDKLAQNPLAGLGHAMGGLGGGLTSKAFSDAGDEQGWQNAQRYWKMYNK